MIASSDKQPRPSRPGRRLADQRELPLLVFLLILTGFFAWRAPGFFNSVNLASIGRDISVIGIMAVGLTAVIITGGIDLSCAATLALSASVMAMLMQSTGMIFLPALAALAVGAVLGGLNGLLVTTFGVPAIVVTLATLSLYRAQAVRLVTLISPLPPGFSVLGRGFVSFGVFLLVLAMAGAALSRTRWGRHVYAVGGNLAAARLSGITTGRTIALTYVVSGLTAGLAAIVASATLNSVQGNMLQGYELDAVAAVVIGGTSVTGGRGGVLGTAIGAAIMAVLRNGLIVAGLDVYWYQAIIGAAILAVAGMDYIIALRRAKEARA